MSVTNSHNRESQESAKTRYHDIVRKKAITVAGGDKGKEPISSGNFIATIMAAGIKDNFIELQIKLDEIINMSPELISFANGDLFKDLQKAFYGQEDSLLENYDLFGDIDTPRSGNVIVKLQSDLKVIANGANIINDAIELVKSMQTRIGDVIANTQSDYISNQGRYEDLLTWAYRKGIRLNPEVLALKKLGSVSKVSNTQLDFYGLLNMLDSIQLYLETLKYLPAYYNTGDVIDTNNVDIPVKTVIVGDNETIQRIAERELGDADKANMILEFNNLSYSDVIGESWAGTKLKIPYSERNTNNRLIANYVLDRQSGIEVLGKDIASSMEVSNGDLKVVEYTENFYQSIENIIKTPCGTIAEQPPYGNRISGISAEMVPEVMSKAIEVEIARAIMTNPRVESVSGVVSKVSGDTIRVKYQVKAINELVEAELKSKVVQ